ncbi:MAG TPA: CU044_5270 family protein [Streptosporangiaceae bacterium]
MDELQLVRELLAERAAPRPEVVAGARARTLSGSARPRRRHRAAIRVVLPVSAVTAAVAAAVVTTVILPASPPELGVFQLPAGAAGARVGSAADGKRILLTAARTTAGARPPVTGRYWVSPAVVGNFLRVGPSGGHYVVLEKVSNQQWSSNSPRDSSPDVTQALGVQLASPADLAAWRRAGSPTTWDTGQSTSIADPRGLTSGSLYHLKAGPAPPATGTVLYNRDQTFGVGDKLLSARQLLKLPTDPARLTALLLAGYSPTRGDGGPDSYLFQTVPGILAMPVTPAVRSALYRILAGLPGVHSLGEVRDAGGQQGVAVTLDGGYTHCASRFGASGISWTFSSCVVQQRLVIDPATGLPLAQELRYLRLPPGQTWSPPDGLFSFQLFGTAHWTNSSPPVR